jgi:hypothetical protein
MNNPKEKYYEDEEEEEEEEDYMNDVDFIAIGKLLEEDKKQAAEKQFAEKQAAEKKSIHESERLLENEQMIINCFMAKEFKELTYSPHNPNWDLGEFISQHLTRDVLLRNNTLDELREGYNNLKKKDEEADALIEDRNAIGRMRDGERDRPIPKWKANCHSYIYEVANSFQFIKVGSSDIHLLTDSAIGRMRDKYKTTDGYIYSYDMLLSDIKDALGCWILTIELLLPEIVNRVGGRRKRKTKKGKTKKRKTTKKRNKEGKNKKKEKQRRKTKKGNYIQ